MRMPWTIDPNSLSRLDELHVYARGTRYAIAFGVAFLLALALTPLARAWARRAGIVDAPDARRIHLKPTPRGGGLAVFAAFHLALAAVVWRGGVEFSSVFSLSWRLTYLGASAMLVAIGVLDDAFSLKPWLKLAGQIAVATILYENGVRFSAFFTAAFPPWANYAMTLFWFVGAINAFNLIDGMDGLAAGLACIASVGLASALFFRGLSLATIPFLALAGACLGFLRYNFHPASVFLGDAGSMFIGLTLATLTLMTATKNELVASLGVPLMAMGIPIFDTGIAIWRRSMRAALPRATEAGSKRVHVMQADKDHVHHRILARTLNQRRAATWLYAINAVLVAIGLSALFARTRALGVFLLAFIVGAFVIVRHLTRVELWDTGRVLMPTAKATISRRLGVPLLVLADLVGLSAAWMGARLLTGMPLTIHVAKAGLLLFVAPAFAMLAATRSYARAWSRAPLREYAFVGVALIAGVLISAGLVILAGLTEPCWPTGLIVYALLAQVPVMGVRLVGPLARELLALIERKVLLERGDAQRLLACGGGERFGLFIRDRRTQTGRNDRVIVGVLDDDMNLRGMFVHGYPVRGMLDDLPRVAAEQRATAVVITALLPAARRGQVVALARQAGIPVTEWVIEERQMV